MSVLPSLSPVNEEPGLSQERPGLLPFPGGTKAEPAALWLESKIGLNEEGDGEEGGSLRSGKLGEALPWGWERAWIGRGRVCLTAQQFCQMNWEGSSGGREGASQEAGGSRAAVGPAAMRSGEGQSRSGRTRGAPQLPAAPALVGESEVGQAPPTGRSTTAPWE